MRATLVTALLALTPLARGQSQEIRQPTTAGPNPSAFLLDPAGGPMVAETWTPAVDASAFSPPPAPGAFFLVAVSEDPAAADVPLGATTLLVSLAPPNPLLILGPVPVTGAAAPVPLDVPGECALAGATFSSQAVLVEPSGSLRFTNAIDLVVGQGPAALYSLSANVPVLHTLDPATGATLTSVSITLPGVNLRWGNGLAQEPLTGRLFAVMRWVGGPSPPAGREQPAKRNRASPLGTPGPVAFTGRLLVTLCPLSGEAILIGDLGDAFAAIAFDGAGTLWGITGDGASNPNRLFQVDTGDATTVPVASLGHGLDGEALGFHPGDGLLYHASGNPWFTGQPAILETIDPANPGAPPVGIPGFATSPINVEETNALSRFDGAAGGFWWAGGCCSVTTPSTSLSTLYLASTTGNGSLIGVLDHLSKGLAVLP